MKKTNKHQYLFIHLLHALNVLHVPKVYAKQQRGIVHRLRDRKTNRLRISVEYDAVPE